MTSTKLVLSRLEGVLKNDSGWEAICPAHDDHRPSLSISTGEDGRCLIHCHAECPIEEVVKAMGLKMKDLYPRDTAEHDKRLARVGTGRPRIVGKYSYRDESGKLLFQVVRFDPKDFRQRRPNGNGGWTWNMRRVRRVLYRLPDLLKADPSRWVFLVEGEKDVDGLIKQGFTATTNPGGAGKWDRVDDAQLQGRRVAILPDNDDVGKAHALDVALRLHGRAAEVRIICLPDLSVKGDVSDWLAAGGTPKQLLALVKAAPKWEPSAESAEPAELDVSGIVRPELFHTTVVSGLAVPIANVVADKPAGRWALLLRWHADGNRSKRSGITSSLELPDGRRLWIHPTPSEPLPTMLPGWSADGRRAWQSGAPAPDPAEVFGRMCECIDQYLEFPPSEAEGYTATLASWAFLTYCYRAWRAVPYLSIGGPLGSGKSTVFAVLAKLVFRPLASSNLTAACLFRTLHEQGGTLLLDEAERLRDGTPEAGELRSILLSGYKTGSPARRLEKTAGGYRQVAYDVYGPKALAGIAALPEALATRCIPLTMFRNAPGSLKPKRRIDDDAHEWESIRDDLHFLALEHGTTWLALARRTDVCPDSLPGRDFELWQPLLSIAAWLDESGTPGLLGMMKGHAERVTGTAREDATPDTEEMLLKLVAEAVLKSAHHDLTPAKLLHRAKERDENTYAKWSIRGVAFALKRYGLAPIKRGGQRVYSCITLDALRRIEAAYGLDLGLPIITATSALRAPCAPARRRGARVKRIKAADAPGLSAPDGTAPRGRVGRKGRLEEPTATGQGCPVIRRPRAESGS